MCACITPRPGRAVPARPRRRAAQDRSRRLLRPAQDRAAGAARWRRSTPGSPAASGSRAASAPRSTSSRSEADLRIKVNPLAHWTKDDVQDYMLNNRLPRHPLVRQGYPSIGCAPCTSRVAAGRGRTRRPLARAGKGRMRHPFHQWQAGARPAAAGRARHERDRHRPGFRGRRLDPSGRAAGRSAGRGRRRCWPSISAPPTIPAGCRSRLGEIDLIRVAFPSFADGRGFTIARRLRLMGYQGRLRAAGHVIADQYAMARRVGLRRGRDLRRSRRAASPGAVAGPGRLARA